MKREVERELEAAAMCERYAAESTWASREIYLKAQERHLDDAMAAACERKDAGEERRRGE